MALGFIALNLTGPGKGLKGLKLADEAADGLKYLDEIAPAKRASKQSVLGSYPDYVKLSDELGARRFDVPKPNWDRMTPDEQWAANRRYLDRMIDKGDEVILSNSASEAQRGTTFFREIEYLKSKGYQVSEDGMKMLPGS
ncbi:MAG: hypothetical protein ACYC5A_11225 [Thermoleophilia bacterium]